MYCIVNQVTFGIFSQILNGLHQKMYSSMTLRQISKHKRTSFEVTNILMPTRSWLIALGIRRQPKDTPYRRSRGGDKLFHKIHSQVVNRASIVSRDSEYSMKSENLIRIKTTALAMIPKQHMLKLSHINVRSVCNKIPSLHHSICNSNIDICAVSKTWIKQDDDHTQRELAPLGYKVLRYPQSDGCVGGCLAFIMKDHLKVTDPTQDTTFSTMETHLITLKLQPINLSIRMVYRLLQVSVLHFCNKFSNMIERSFNMTKDKSIIIGYFNIHMDTLTESDVIIFNNLLESLNMKNRITFLTHKSLH